MGAAMLVVSDGSKLAIQTVGPRLAMGNPIDRFHRRFRRAVRMADHPFANGRRTARRQGGAYVGTPEAAHRVGWVFDRPLEHFSFEQFAREFHRPEIVRRRLLGGNDLDQPVSRSPGARLLSATVVGTTAHLKLAEVAP